MDSSRNTRLVLAALLVLSVLALSTVLGTVAGTESPADAPDVQSDNDSWPTLTDCPLCVEPPTAPCDATCVATPTLPPG